MRVYRRKEFLSLPDGTIYAKGKPWFFKGLTVKADTSMSGNDWWSLDPCWIDSKTGEEVWDYLPDMLENGASHPMQTAVSRDGMNDKEDLFLVFEVSDLQNLRGMIDKAIEVAQ